MPLSILALILALGCCLPNIIIAGVFGARFQKSYKKNKSLQIKYISRFFIFLSVFLLFSTLPHIFGVGDVLGLLSISTFKPFLFSIGSWCFTLSYIFLFLALAYFVMVPASLSRFAKYKLQAFSLMIILGIVFTAINLIGGKEMLTDPFTQGSVVALTPLMFWFLIGSLAVVWIPFFILSIFGIVRSASGKIKIRAALLMMGLLMIVARIISHDFLHGAGLHATWDLLCSVGLILVGIGVYFVKFKTEESLAKTKIE